VRRSALLLVLLPLTACQTPGTPGFRPGSPPEYAALADAHNTRLARLGRVYGRGNIELRWTDESGRHFEQGDLDLWYERPDRLALNVSKFGERIMWLGAGPGRAWLFDLRNGESTLYCTADSVGWMMGSETGLPVTPPDLLALAGLEALPDEPTTVSYAAADDAWVVTLRQPDRERRVFLDRRSGLPVRVEDRTMEGSWLATSTINLARYKTVTLGNLPGGAAFPTLIDIRTGHDGGSVRLAVGSPNDDVDTRYFDLEWLIGVLEPEQTEGPCGQLAGP
jgi:hypothetical protein